MGYIRIDGSVSAEQKRIRAEIFQKNDSVQIAILSIVAAGTGTSLTLPYYSNRFIMVRLRLYLRNQSYRCFASRFRGALLESWHFITS